MHSLRLLCNYSRTRISKKICDSLKMISKTTICLTPYFFKYLKRNVSSQSEWTIALPFECIPGPKSIVLLGNFWRFLPGIGDLANLDTTQLHVELNRRFGDIVKLDGLPGKAPFIFLYNAKDVAKMFHTEGEFPVRDSMHCTRHYRSEIRPEPYTRVGHLVDHGYQWKKFRSRVNQLLMVQSNIDVYEDAVVQVINDFIVRIKRTRNQNNETVKDFIKELKKWALEVLGVVALDHRFGCLEDTLSREASEIMEAVEQYHHTTYILDMQPVHLWKYFSTSTFRKMVSSLDYLHCISEKYVMHAQRKSLEKGPKSILETLVSQGGDGKDVAVVLAVDMFLAGVEIIGGMAATLMYALAKHPESQQWLADKVRSHSQEDALPYLRAFIKESMRMWPVAVGTMRTAAKDIVLSGYRIPKGNMLISSNCVMCRSPAYFDNPLQFYPERWMEDKIDYSQYAFAPFGIGSRSCIGRRIAMLEMELFLMAIISNFKVEYYNGEVQFDSRFLNVISSPLQFTLNE